MILTSFNIRGLGSGSKRIALKHFIEATKLGIVVLQETTMSTSFGCDLFLKIKPCWRVCTSHAVGTLGNYNCLEPFGGLHESFFYVV